MGIFFWLVVWICFWHPPVYAQSQTLILSGGGDLSSDAPRYDHINQYVYRIESQRNKGIHLVLNRDHWKFPASLHQYPDNSFGVEEALQAASKALEPGDAVTVFISGHGTLSILDYLGIESLENGIALYSNQGSSPMTHHKLMNLIRKHIPVTHWVRLIGVHCFSGDLHRISFELPNVCSAASTSYKTVSNTSLEISAYGKAVWDQVKQRAFRWGESSEANLFESHFLGLISDHRNKGLNEISSMDYVDSVLRKGVHAWVEIHSIQELFFDHSSERISGEALSFREIEKIEKLFAKLKPWISYYPHELQSAYAGLLDLWDQDVQVTSIKKSLIQLEARWIQLSRSEKNEQRLSYFRDYTQIMEDSPLFADKALGFFKMLRNLVKVNKFLEKADPHQMDQFKRMLQCEWSSL